MYYYYCYYYYYYYYYYHHTIAQEEWTKQMRLQMKWFDKEVQVASWSHQHVMKECSISLCYFCFVQTQLVVSLYDGQIWGNGPHALTLILIRHSSFISFSLRCDICVLWFPCPHSVSQIILRCYLRKSPPHQLRYDHTIGLDNSCTATNMWVFRK